ncbi:AMP-binding protein [Fervidibacillus albus]|uniref:acetate--CoA ligase n=1 Tax=Fervidibacillus albus TaxID=2980026 RepID=A0A9E8LWU9_9BACI|nr:AMP-binding protein [Fervidibacillus albus]WAA11140.1 AMP-binding protein [Fervidibacillus albus]
MRGFESASKNERESKIVWYPTEEQKKLANVTKFMEKHHLKSYEKLYEKSVQDPEWFYPAILEQLQIPWIKEYEKVMDLSKGKELPTWFKGGRTNLYVYGLEKHLKNGNGDQIALVWEGENGATISKTYAQLKKETDLLATQLKALGVKKGDRVGVFLPQIPEIQPILFACAKIGAIIIPCFSGFGADAVAFRLNDGGAKWLFTADGFYRRGKIVNMKQVSDRAVAQVPTIEKVIHVKNIQRTKRDPAFSYGEKDVFYDDLINNATEIEEVNPEPMASDEPLMIIYTSGTTGKPKGTQHTHISFPLKNAIDLYFAFDVKRNDRMFWLTDIGWMMGPWLIYGTAILGATAVIYEGSPDYPNEHRLWELVEKHKITIFGIAPTVIRSLMKFGDNVREQYDLSSLRILGSTGEPWNPKPWLWYFENVGGGKCPIINYSGGTEISGGILSCLPMKPQKPCSFNGPLPGMATEIVDPSGTPVQGEEVGDLVITQPFLGMTYSFWKDHERYLNSYWRRWNGLWYHGDFAQKDEDGFWFILGRSDDTMNIAGKRLGPADLESIVTSHPMVRESAVIPIPDEVKGEVPILFVVLHEKVEEQRMCKEIKELVAEKLGKAFLPKEVYIVDELPRTQSGKIARRILRSAYLGQSLGDISTLQNPEMIQQVSTKRQSN